MLLPVMVNKDFQIHKKHLAQPGCMNWSW